MNSRTDVAQLIHLDPPTVEADPVFLARLAGLATASRPSPTPDGRVGGLRIAAAAAGVLVVTAGAAAQHVRSHDDAPQPVRPAPVPPDVTRSPDRPTDDGDQRNGVRPQGDSTATHPADHATDGHAGVGSQPTGAPGAGPTTGVAPGDDGQESDGASTSPTDSDTSGDDQGDDHRGDQGDGGSGDGSGDTGGGDDSSDDSSGSGSDDGSDDPTAGATAADGSDAGDIGVAIPDPGDGDGGQTDH